MINSEFLKYIKALIKFMLNIWDSKFKIEFDKFIPIVKSMTTEILNKFDGYIDAKSISHKWGYSDNNCDSTESLCISFPFRKPTVGDKISTIDIIFEKIFISEKITVLFTGDELIKYEYDSSFDKSFNSKFLEWLNS